ncbi:MAG TPA: hypothetical protein VGK02_01835, partial [Candidatus Aquicultor sp.]
MKKGLVILMALAMLFAMSTAALAVQELNSDPSSTFVIGAKGNIVANTYTPVASDSVSYKDYKYYEQGLVTTTTVFAPYGGGNGLSTHVYGTWNSPYTVGIDGYNYNDAQDYVETGKQEANLGDPTQLPINPQFQSQLMTWMGANLPGPMVAGMSSMMSTATVGPYAGDRVINTHLAGNFQSGPHGGYLTSTHRCRECHAVHRAAGKFKLLRSDTRF